MKRATISLLAVLALLSALIPLTAWQNTPTIGVLPDSGPALPATCVVGQIYFKTTATTGLNQCATVNTWTAIGGSGSGTVNAGTANQVAFYPASAAAVSGSTGLTYDQTHTLTISVAGGGAGTLALSGNTSGTATFAAPAVAGTATNPVTISNVLSLPNGTAANPSVSATVGAGYGWGVTSGGLNFWTRNTTGVLSADNAGVYMLANGANRIAWINGDPVGSQTGYLGVGSIAASAAVLAVGTGAAGNHAGLIQSGMTVFVTGDFTTSGVGTALENITGLTYTFPATALNWSFHCHVGYHQNAANAAVAFGLQDTTNAPTNLMATGHIQTAATTFTEGVLAALSTTTATNVVSATPSAITTNWVAEVDGTVEHGATAHTLNLMVSTATAADTVTVLRGSYCALTP